MHGWPGEPKWRCHVHAFISTAPENRSGGCAVFKFAVRSARLQGLVSVSAAHNGCPHRGFHLWRIVKTDVQRGCACALAG